MGASVKVGVRVRLTCDVERYPFGIAREGAVGTVVYAGADAIHVRMDETVAGMEEWGNEVHWYPTDGDDILVDVEVLS